MSIDSKSLLLCLIVLLITGCGGGTKDSESTNTNELRSTISVTAIGDGTTTITARFTTSEGTISGFIPITSSVRLSGGDELTATANGLTQTFLEDTNGGGATYTSEFSFEVGPTDFVIHFNRPSRSELLEATVNLPADMQIQSPAEGEMYSINDTIPILWAAPQTGSTLCVCASTNCYQNTTQATEFCDCSVNDDGGENVTLPGLTGFGNGNLVSSNSCTANYSLSRTNTGVIFPGVLGRISATQKRTRSVTYALP
jgi:hypothetical protein